MAVTERLSIGPAGETSTIVANVSVVAFGETAVMFRGASGSGKSTNCLQLLALGGKLVSDDGAVLTRCDDRITVDCPLAIEGKIEARGLGILAVEHIGPAQLAFVVDLDQTETQRLPEQHFCRVMGVRVPLLKKVDGPQFVPAIVQLLKGGFAV